MKRASITEELVYGSALERLTGGEGPGQTEAQEERTEQGGKTKRVPAEAKAKPARKAEPPTLPVIKLSVFLSRAEDAYLESLSSVAKFSGGKKLSKTRLVEAMVRAFRSSKLDVRGVKTEEELRQRVIAQLRR